MEYLIIIKAFSTSTGKIVNPVSITESIHWYSVHCRLQSSI